MVSDVNAPIFGHGQLRLYLLSLLDEGPLSGYDVIRTLEQRFDGLYSPSAGTIYPRLSKLEEEGLVTRTDEGRRSIYSITDAGREELSRRSDEVAGLGEHVQDSSARLAEELRRKVTDGATTLWAELDNAARAARARAEEQDRAKGESSSGTRGSGGSGESGSEPPPWMRSGRGSVGGIPVEAFESLARDFTAANRFRSEHGTDFAKFAQWAASGFGGRGGGGTPWWTARPEDAARPSAQSSPDEAGETGGTDDTDEVIAEVIDEAQVLADTTDTGPGDSSASDSSGALDEAQVRRVIGILRTAADDLEKTLGG